MYAAEHHGRPAILKLYDDEVVSVEGESLRQFHDHNRSEILTAPELYGYETASLTRGWLLIERLPDEGTFLQSPLSEHDRAQFVKIFVDYRANFPHEPNRPLAFAECDDAYQFHAFRLMRSVETASTVEQYREFTGQDRILDATAFTRRVVRALEHIHAVLAGQPLHWGHGHFKPNELYHHPEGERWALTDFGHTKMLPPGYEPALVVWWDQMMEAPASDYQSWRSEIDDWIDHFVHALDGLTDDVMRASLVERSLTTVLEWLVTDEDLPADERNAHLERHERFIDELC
jgi:hypothetical protein